MLRFGREVPIDSADGLDETARAQIAAAGKLYDGSELTAEERLANAPEDGWKGFCHHAPIYDGNSETKLYDAWFYMVDSGTFFRAGTTDVIAQIIQFGLECEDPQLHAELEASMSNVKLPF